MLKRENYNLKHIYQYFKEENWIILSYTSLKLTSIKRLEKRNGKYFLNPEIKSDTNY